MVIPLVNGCGNNKLNLVLCEHPAKNTSDAFEYILCLLHHEMLHRFHNTIRELILYMSISIYLAPPRKEHRRGE
jgi:hypothetical protein